MSTNSAASGQASNSASHLLVLLFRKLAKDLRERRAAWQEGGKRQEHSKGTNRK
jgi:hypothetical protein